MGVIEPKIMLVSLVVAPITITASIFYFRFMKKDLKLLKMWNLQ